MFGRSYCCTNVCFVFCVFPSPFPRRQTGLFSYPSLCVVVTARPAHRKSLSRLKWEIQIRGRVPERQQFQDLEYRFLIWLEWLLGEAEIWPSMIILFVGADVAGNIKVSEPTSNLANIFLFGGCQDPRDQVCVYQDTGRL